MDPEKLRRIKIRYDTPRYLTLSQRSHMTFVNQGTVDTLPWGTLPWNPSLSLSLFLSFSPSNANHLHHLYLGI